MAVERHLRLFESTVPDRFQPLFKAILRDDRDGVEELLGQDAALATSAATEARYETGIAHWVYAGDTALHVAAAGYRVEIAGMLVDAGADCSSAKNHRSSQPLHYASDGYLESKSWDAKRQVRMIELLLKAGADIHAQDKNGATPLHRAVRTRCTDAVKCLLNAGSDATLKNRPGSTPFHLAVQNTGRGGSGAEKAKTAQREIIRAFLERGVSPDLKDGKGKSVVAWARSDWVRECLQANRVSMRANANKHDADGQPKNGVFKEHYKDGTLACAGKYRNGEKVGVWKYYLRNGQLRAVGKFAAGKMTGLWKWYRENGKLMQTGSFTDEKKSGVWRRYHPNGALYDEGRFVDNQKVGEWRVYDAKGKLVKTATHKARG